MVKNKKKIQRKKRAMELCEECGSYNLLDTGLSIYCNNCGYDDFQTYN